jgi:hypothetical protein
VVGAHEGDDLTLGQLLDRLYQVIAHRPLNRLPDLKDHGGLAAVREPAFAFREQVAHHHRHDILGYDCARLSRSPAGVIVRQANNGVRERGAERPIRPV